MTLTDTLIDIAAPVYPLTLRASAIKVGYLKSLLHMRYYMTQGREDTTAMRFGRLVHLAALQPSIEPAVWHGGRRAGKEYDAWLASVPHGQETATEAEWLAACDCAESVRQHDDAFDLIRESKREFSLKHTTGEYGPCSARLDAWKPGCLVDLKTTGAIGKRAVASNCAAMAYHIQFGWYWYMLELMGLDTRPACYIIAVESKPPYDCGVYELSRLDVSIGYTAAKSIAGKFRSAELARKWPGMQENKEVIELPEWAHNDAALGMDVGSMIELGE